MTAPLYTDIADVESALFTFTQGSNASSYNDDFYEVKADGEYKKMIAPTLYGGRRLFTPDQYDDNKNVKKHSDRTRRAYEHDLIVGDILLVKSDTVMVYIYDGNDLIALHDGSVNAISGTVDEYLITMPAATWYYAVLRPSMVDAR